jgi:PPK2 family polyphosphate:nucleotide phosphotransferase
MTAKKQFRCAHPLRLKEDAANDKVLSSGDKAEDRERFGKLAEKIASYQDIFYAEHRRKLLVILQGMDCSGKDGTARDVFGRLHPLGVRCVSFKVPSIKEREHDYLWRIHQQVPGEGEIVIFNRSHYEDVLSPVVHGQIDSKECKRRYQHFRGFESMLFETGTVVVKFFLHISRDEQKQRLQARLMNPDKHWKFDPNDLVDRKYWDDYQRLYEKALEETDTDEAPWYVIPADSKSQRNLAVASIMVETLQDMKLAYPPPNPEYFQFQVI